MDSKEDASVKAEDFASPSSHDFAERLGPLLSAVMEEKTRANAAVLKAYESKLGNILTGMDSLFEARRTREKLWNEALSNERLDELKDELARQRAENGRLRAELEGLQARTDDFGRELREAQTLLQTTQAQKQEMLDANEAFLRENTTADGSAQVLREELETSKAEIAGLASELDEARSLLEQARQKRLSLEDEADLARQALAVAQAEAVRGSEALGPVLAAEREKSAGLEQELKDVSRRLQEVLARTQADQDKLAGPCPGCETYLGELAQARENLASREREVSRLENELAQARPTPQAPKPESGPAAPGCALSPKIWGAFALLFFLILGLGVTIYRQTAAQNVRSGQNYGSAGQNPSVPGEGSARIGQELESIQRSLDSLPARGNAEILPLLSTIQAKLDALEVKNLSQTRPDVYAGSQAVPDGDGARPLRAVIGFGLGEAEVSEDDGRQAREIAENILDSGAKSVLVVGYADNTRLRGDLQARYEDNLMLSRSRAQSVARVLIKSGVNPRVVVAYGVGQAMPVAPNDTPENRARNRRVEIIAW